MTSFQSLAEYETFVYTLPHQFPSIQRSTLIVARRGLILTINTSPLMSGITACLPLI